MAIPEEHRENAIKYFETVERIIDQIKQNYRDQGMSEADITLSDTSIVVQANTMAKEVLGFSYYPWPFAIDESKIVNIDGDQNV